MGVFRHIVKKFLKGGLAHVGFIWYLLFVFWLCSSVLTAQNPPKKQLSAEDYHLWGQLSFKKVSYDGQWISYTMSYDQGLDTLFVKNDTKPWSYAFPKGQYGVFGKSDWFAVQSDQGLELLDLRSGARSLMPQVEAWAFALNGDLLVVLVREPQGASHLKIIKPFGETLLDFTNVTDYKLSPDKRQLCYVTYKNGRSGLGLIDLSKGFKHRMVDTVKLHGYGHHLVWDRHGRGLAFLKKASPKSIENDLVFFDIQKHELKTFNPKDMPGLPDDAYISYTSNYRLSLSDDLTRVFFAIKKKVDGEPPEPVRTDVQIWNGNAAWTYRQMERSKHWFESRVGVWDLTAHTVRPITSDSLPYMMLTGDQKAVVSFNPRPQEIHYEFNDPIDFYITDIRTNQSKLMLKKQEHNMSELLPSPAGGYVSYFKDKHWWVYDIKADKHVNMTASIPSHFENRQNDHAGNKGPYGMAGWTKDDASLWVYDRFDLWEIPLKTGVAKRWTPGRAQEIQYRIARDRKALYVPNFNGFNSKVIDPKSPLLLHAKGADGRSGYFWSSPELGLQKICYKASLLDQAMVYDTGMVCREQRFNQSPRLIRSMAGIEKNRLLYQSNPHQSDYYWGSSKTVAYTNSLKDTLKGVLCYPANYQPDKKYPMIVHIYERQFRDRHGYTPPTLYNALGFNPTNFTAMGYFVLYPDIVFELGKPGYSATDCVTAAVNKVIAMGVVKADKIGLIGHSFGGYETDFIMTQTDLFATAISGAASTDLQSHYLNLNMVTGKPDIWRFENQQWRMGKSLFTDPELYKINTPLTYAHHIKSPILSWSGLQDYQVDFHQTIIWYLALRRLNKKHIALFYPDEPHWLLERKNQVDLSKRMAAWFAHFLKDAPAAPWIKKGLE